MQELTQRAEQVSDTLALFFSTATGSHRQLVMTNEYLLAATCTALGSCATWLSSRRDAALSNAVALVMGAVVSGNPPRVCPQACRALKRLCSEQVPADVLPLQDVVNVCGRSPVLCPCSAVFSCRIKQTRTTMAACLSGENMDVP